MSYSGCSNLGAVFETALVELRLADVEQSKIGELDERIFCLIDAFEGGSSDAEVVEVTQSPPVETTD